VEAVDEPRWLSAEEQQTWLAVVAMVTWLPDAVDAQLQRDAGVSHFEYQVMAMLSMSPQRTRRMSEVAALANGSLTRLSRTVDRLERRGWVHRRPDPEDGRSTLAVLTDEGWDKVVATAPGHAAEVRRLVLDPLTRAQVRQLRDIADRIATVAHPAGCLPVLPTPTAGRRRPLPLPAHRWTAA
jgi:DNA-binding MarR family transcriptional regulator